MNDQRLARVDLDISVVIGSTEIPIHQLLRMGRGPVIELDATIENCV
jgi:flagellar motor switch protein FliN/FliY|tara:strand:+ start:152 stop:292 length:141 start_codon:yes stop_codon:yes gene_type:complete